MPMTVADLSETLGPEAEPAQEAGFVWTLLPRHGRRPARFLGRVLLHANNCALAEVEAMPFWSDVHVHECCGGGFVISVRHMRVEDDVAGFQDLWQAESGAAVIASLRGHDIVAALPGGTSRPQASLAARQAWQALLDSMFGRDARA
jgi:hypothetical protein